MTPRPDHVPVQPVDLLDDRRGRVVPLRDGSGEIVGVLDVDSEQPEAFGEVDVVGLERIVALIYA